MSEYVVRVDLSTAPSSPQVIPETVGVPITRVIVNGALPAGVTFRIMRKGQQSGPILNGSPTPTGGGDDTGDLFCPPLSDGLAVLWTPGVPGTGIELICISGGGGSLSRA